MHVYTYIYLYSELSEECIDFTKIIFSLYLYEVYTIVQPILFALIIVI